MITRWFYDLEPTFGDFDSFKDELERMFDIGLPQSNIRSVPRGTFPSINTYDDKNAVCINVYVPGIDPKKLELIFQDNSLILKGERDTSQIENKEIDPESYHRRERFSGTFSRIVSLPEGLDSEKIEAHYNDGILQISIGKTEEKKPKQISVKVS
jgi:HSP20 family protein